MCNNPTNDCNDYSQLTANTGITSISTANPNLNGTGTMGTVLTAGANGTILRSVTIKSTPMSQLYWSQQGMIRLFIQNSAGTITSLYKEIPVPPVPEMAAPPLPPPVFTTFEAVLTGDLKLEAGTKLMASTQVANPFNIIAEGLDWTYPDPIPDVCCNFVQESGVTGVGIVSVANPNYDDSGTLVTLLTADVDANGTTIKRITIKALQSTHEGVVRFFIGDGSKASLLREVHIPQTEQSAYVPSFKHVIEMDFKLQAGYSISASTLFPESFAITVEGESWIYPS